jgi:hypothetical protein
VVGLEQAGGDIDGAESEEERPGAAIELHEGSPEIVWTRWEEDFDAVGGAPAEDGGGKMVGNAVGFKDGRTPSGSASNSVGRSELVVCMGCSTAGHRNSAGMKLVENKHSTGRSRVRSFAKGGDRTMPDRTGVVVA